MQILNTTKTIALLSTGLSALSYAGEFAPHSEIIPEVSSQGTSHFCDALTSIGSLYKNSDNPIIQEFKLTGRFQYQTAYIDGSDVNNDDFSEDFEEVRRFRIGTKIKFLNYFELKGAINLADDDRATNGDLDWGYQDFDTATIGVNLQKAFGIDGLDTLSLSYGRQKFYLGHEARDSSKTILTPERSALSNKVYGSYRPTGFQLKFGKGNWDAFLGLYSTEEAGEFVEGWGEGLAYQGTFGYQFSDELKVTADFAYNGASEGDESIIDYQWASSLAADYNADRWGVVTEFIYGDNGDESNGVANADRQGQFWGAIVLPYYWLVEERLQLVGRYQYAASSESEGIRLNSRYLRRNADTGADVNGGRGDEHHSIYLGLNYYFCGHNSKVFAGVEYDNIDTPDGDVEGLTYWLGYRTFF